MFNKNAFRAAIVLRGKTLSDAAKCLEIDNSTLYRKMNGKSDFTRKEIQTLCEYFQIENPMEIFFNDGVA